MWKGRQVCGCEYFPIRIIASRSQQIPGLSRTFNLNFHDQNHFPRLDILPKKYRTFQEARRHVNAVERVTSDVDANASSPSQSSSGQTSPTLQLDKCPCDWCHKCVCDTPTTAVISMRNSLPHSDHGCHTAITVGTKSIVSQVGMWRSQEKFAFVKCEFHPFECKCECKFHYTLTCLW